MQTLRSLSMVFALGLIALLLTGAGWAPGPADFNGDGLADLAIGVHMEDVRSIVDAGAVNVLYGTKNGLLSTKDQIWDQDDLSGDPDGAEMQDFFGQALAAGDLNGDGAVDLVIGVPGEDIGSAVNGGAVHVIYGERPDGLRPAGDEMWHQGTPGIKGAVESHDFFGQAISIGDFDGDGFDDMAIGAPLEDIESAYNAGAVNVIYGSPSGPTGRGDQIWYEGTNGLAGTPETDDWFGQVLAAGDFNGDGYDDLSIAIPGEDLGGDVNAGRVITMYGSDHGLTAVNAKSWVQGIYGVPDNHEPNDYFGRALTAGDFNGDGFADLAIGDPNEDWGSSEDVGMVIVLFGSSQGLTTDGNQRWFDGGMEGGDGYGGALAAGDFNGDGRDELAVGVPSEDLGSAGNAGAVEVLYGGTSGLHRRVVNDFWHQDRTGVLDHAEGGDNFGMALTTGNFDGDAYTDLAVGICYEDVGSKMNAGAVQIFYGSSAGIVVDFNQFWTQDSPHIEGASEAEDRFGCPLIAMRVNGPDKLYLPMALRND